MNRLYFRSEGYRFLSPQRKTYREINGLKITGPVWTPEVVLISCRMHVVRKQGVCIEDPNRYFKIKNYLN